MAGAIKHANESDDSEESCSALQSLLERDNDDHTNTKKIVVEGYQQGGFDADSKRIINKRARTVARPEECNIELQDLLS
jgi:hypothetical protein